LSGINLNLYLNFICISKHTIQQTNKQQIPIFHFFLRCFAAASFSKNSSNISCKSGYTFSIGSRVFSLVQCSRKYSTVFHSQEGHHYEACSDKSNNGLSDAQTSVHASMMSIPLAIGLCPVIWKHVIDAMLEKIPGVVRSNKLHAIQLLEADLSQVLRITFTRNITNIAQEHEGISNYQYGRVHKICMSPVLNKLLTIQLLIQKKVNRIVFDNDVNGCYDRIVSGMDLSILRRLGYSK
jgi:hypothetical protein